MNFQNYGDFHKEKLILEYLCDESNLISELKLPNFNKLKDFKNKITFFFQAIYDLGMKIKNQSFNYFGLVDKQDRMLIKKELKKANKEKAKQECKQLKETTNFLIKELPNRLFSFVRKKKGIVKECLESNDYLLLEKKLIVVIQELINKVPPFKYFESLKVSIERGVNKAGENLSSFTNLLGGPGVYTFPIISGILAIILEDTISDTIRNAALTPLLSIIIPIAPAIFFVIEIVGKCAAVVEISENIGLLSKDYD